MSEGKIDVILDDETFNQIWGKMEQDHIELAIYAEDDVKRKDATARVQIIREFRDKLRALAADAPVHRKRAVA